MFGKKKAVVHVEGMMCPHCAAHVEKALGGIEGVENAKVDLAKKNATVVYKGELSAEAVEKAIVEAGYKYQGIEA